MTWHTPRGDRVLAGPEAELFRDALMIVTDWIEGDVDQDQAFHEFGIPAFDSATARGKLALLAEVSHALLVETDGCPKLTVVNESTVGAIFFALEQSVEHEIYKEFDFDCETEFDSDLNQGCDAEFVNEFDSESESEFDTESDQESEVPDGMFWRRLILQAIGVADAALEKPDANCGDLDEWSFLIDILRDRILWDRDFEAEPTFGDADPAKAHDARLKMGIDESYFRTVAPDPSDEELAAIRLRLRLLRD